MPLSIGSFPYDPRLNPYQRIFSESLETAGLNVIRIPPTKWWPIQTAFNVDCDILHFDWPHDWYNGKNLFTRWLKSSMYRRGLRKESKSKLIWTVHNLQSHNCIDVGFEREMIQLLINRCDGLMLMSQSALELLRKSYFVSSEKSIRVVYHGHYCDAYPNVVTRKAARNALHIAEKDFLAVTIGSIKPYKGIEQLLERFLMRPVPEMQWIIAGEVLDESFRDRLGELIKRANRCGNRIELRPSVVKDIDLQGFFNAADAAILPFDQILNSGSLLLAMSFGVPVFAANKGSIPEIAHPRWSILFDAEDDVSKTLQDGIQYLKAFDDSDSIRREIISYVRERYDWGTVGSRLKQWYHEISDDHDVN